MKATTGWAARLLLIKFAAVGFPLCALVLLPAAAQIGGTGWKPLPLNFKVQSPTNAPESARYFFTNNIYHCLVFSNDGAFSIGNTTLPRTEQRFNPDYTNGEIQYQSTMMAPSNENSYCVFQIHTGDAQSDQYGSTTFMAFWFTNNNGSVHDYSGTTLATNLGNKWFQLNVDHNMVTETIRVWINQQLVWTQQDNGAGDFYFKDGVYEQSHGPTLEMDTYITNTIQEWTNTGVNPPAAPTGLMATPTVSQILLTWNSSVAATNYNVKRSTVSGGPYTNIASLSGTNYTDTAVSNGVTYYYVVSALDQFGESSNSTPVAASLFNLGYELSVAPSAVAMLIGGGTNFTITMTTNTGFSGIVTLGISGLPAHATANFSPPTLNQDGTSILSVQTATNTPGGNYLLSISGTNGASVYTTTVNLALTTLSSAAGTLVWTNGATGVNWSSDLNWLNINVPGFGPPGISNSVVFTNWSAVSTSALTAPGSGVVIPTSLNSTVDGSFSVIGLTNFANAPNTSPVYQNLGLAGGTTLTTGGVQVGGFGVYDFGANNTVNLSVSGAGATLLVTNGGVTISQGSGGNGAHDASLDLSGLDNFVMNGTQIRLGVENITRAGGILYLARTNTLTLTTGGYINSDGSGSPYSGNPALYLGHNKSALGNGAQLYLGLANTISVDYITVGRGDDADRLEFNPAFLSQNPSVTIQGLAGAGARTGVYVVGDNSAGEGGSTFNTNDFTGGTVYALVNYLCVARGRQGASDTTTCTASLTFNSGGINANNLAIGFIYPSGSNSFANGTVNVNGGTLTVISNLTLATLPAGGTASAQGMLNITGGTVLATNIAGGGGVSAVNLNSGTLNLKGAGAIPGQITGISTLNIGSPGVVDEALLANAASINAASPIVIAANGTLAGNTLITAPALIVEGNLSPGVDGTGAITNTGTTTLAAGGSLALTVQDATRGPVNGWDFFQTGGLLDVESSNASPFTIQLQSFDPGGSGLVTNFNAGTNYVWTIATATGGITNFSADKFAVDTSLFQNNLAGGIFSVQTNGNSLVLEFASLPSPPVIGKVALFGNDFIFSGAGGVADGTYYVLSSTNLALPLANWQVVSTNQFDGGGNFSFTNTGGAGTAQSFYLLKLSFP